MKETNSDDEAETAFNTQGQLEIFATLRLLLPPTDMPWVEARKKTLISTVKTV